MSLLALKHCIDFLIKFPPTISAKLFVHSCIFIKVGDDGDGILVEYGGYVKGDDDYPHEVFYLKEDGLRYTQWNLRDFKNKMEKNNEEINNADTKIKNIPYIKCRVNSHNLFFQLLLELFLEKCSTKILN